MLVYVASPYSHSDENVRESRFEAVRRYVAQKYQEGSTDVYFSPILYCHEMAVAYGLPTDAEFWMVFDTVMLEKADKLEVLAIDGWGDSVGVNMEIANWKIAKKGAYSLVL